MQAKSKYLLVKIIPNTGLVSQYLLALLKASFSLLEWLSFVWSYGCHGGLGGCENSSVLGRRKTERKSFQYLNHTIFGVDWNVAIDAFLSYWRFDMCWTNLNTHLAFWVREKEHL